MELIRVAAADLNQIPLAWEHNKRNILGALEEASEQDVSILCLPALCIPGYCCEDAFYAHHTVERSWEMLREILPHTRGMVVSLGLPTLFRNALFNAAALIVDGKLLGLVAKKFLAGDGIYYEPRWFKPWPEGIQATIEHGAPLDPDWKRRTYGENWSTGDTYNAAFGQGYVTTTPLQLINSTAAIVNNGVLYQPTLIRDFLDAEGNITQPFEPKPLRHINLSEVPPGEDPALLLIEDMIMKGPSSLAGLMFWDSVKRTV